VLLNQNIIRQNNEIENQRIQIQSFAGKIGVLKKQVDTLSKLENKVRLIAGINQTSNSSGLIGIGGITKNEWKEIRSALHRLHRILNLR